MRRQAIAIFNPQDPLESTVQDICHERFSKWLPAVQVKGIIEALVGYDGLFEEFLKRPENILNEIFDTQEDNGYLYIPCYTLELRQILRQNIITSPYRIAAFGSSFARRSLTAYPVLIVLDRRRLSRPELELKGLSVFGNELNIASAVVRVLCRERVDSESAVSTETIVTDECPTATVHSITEVPGLSVPKMAQVHQLKKYRVSISSMGIGHGDGDIINAHTPEEAVQVALDRVREKGKTNPLDPKFTVDYWKATPYWPMIVREANHHGLLKEAAATDLQIQLSPTEDKIFSFLLGVNKKYNLGLTFRVAGGWVRDKALGKESDDIDIALDKMTGGQFGQFISKEIGKAGNVIKANPEQSKHLETLTITLFGQDVDFVNLRSESYGDSRIPEMEFGDAETDAFRRDLTINALFYNLNNGQVEDYTGKGLEDLKSMTLRTPLDPVKTFMDDPLRILRMLRFYSRYKGSTVDPTAIEAMKQPQVQEALKSKVSPERIYTEWGKMFAGSQQTAALRILHDTGLWQKLFKDQLKGRENKVDDTTHPDGFRMEPSKELHPFTMDQNNPWHVDNVIDHTLKVVEKYDAILRADGAGDDERARALAAAWLHDLGKLDPTIIGVKENAEGILKNTYHGHEDVSALVAKSILEALKASNEDVEYIQQIVQNHMLPHNEMTDKQIRKLINKLGRDLVKRIVQHAMADADSKPGADLSHYHNLLNKVQTLEPSADMGNGNLKPVLSGQIIMQMFPNIHPKTGYIKDINVRLQDMKDENPAMTEQDSITAVEAMRADIEAKYGGNQPAAKAKPKQPQPVQPPQEGNMKQAQTWYETMRETGEKPEQMKWLCGLVYKGPFSSQTKATHDVIFLQTDEMSYKLRVQGSKNPFTDENLDKLVGKRICAKGMLEAGYLFMMSEWKEANDPNDPNLSYIKREQPEEATEFQVGQKVRHRQRGLAFAQITGEIKQIKDNLMFVKWEGVKELEVFNLNDTANLHINLSKI